MHETEFQGNWVIEVQLFLMTSNSSIAGQRSMHGLSPIAQLTTILILLQSIFVRPINAKIMEDVVGLMDLKNIFVLVYKEFQAFIVKVRNYI